MSIGRSAVGNGATILIAMLLLAGCRGGPTTTSPDRPPDTAPSPGVVVVDPDPFAIAPASVTVPKFELWKQGRRDPAPDKGNVFVSALVRIEAKADSDYSPYYAKVRDGEGFEYDWLIVPRREPSLGSGELAPGDSVQGWVTFEVPRAQAGDLTFLWDSLFGEQIQVDLSDPR